MFQCYSLFCGETFGKLGDLVKHLEVHREGHLCEICGEVFDSKRSLKRHLEVHRVSIPQISHTIDLTHDPVAVVSIPVSAQSASSSVVAYPVSVATPQQPLASIQGVFLQISDFGGSNKYFCPSNSNQVFQVITI